MADSGEAGSGGGRLSRLSRVRRGRRVRPHVLDWIAFALLALGGAAVASGLLPTAQAGAAMSRVLPLLLFLSTVIVLAELTARARVFDVLAVGVARLARGRHLTLFLLCVGFTSLTTITLNLDTTAVLLTPVMLALAEAAGLASAPLAMTTVWLANTASLLLPVSNLTNLLAADRVGLSAPAFAARMWVPQLVAVAVTACWLWVCFWRPTRPASGRFQPPAPQRPEDRILFTLAALACGLFVLGILLGVPLGIASAVAAVIVVAGFACRARSELRLSLIPWRLLVFVTGLFLVVETISRHGLSRVLGALAGAGGGWVGALRTAGVGAGLANLINNLPAYLAGEAVTAPHGQEGLLALLVGVNVGPLVTPWASLATLLWYERCRAVNVRVPIRRFIATGLLLVTTALAATTTTLWLTG